MFYGVFAATLWLPRRIRGAGLVAILLAMPVVGLWLVRFSVASDFYLSPLTAELGFGVALALVMKRWNPHPTLAYLFLLGGAVLAVVGAAAWDGNPFERLVLLCLPMILVLTGAVGLDRAGRMPIWRLPKALGDASYALYMIHPLMLSAMVQIWKRFGGATAPGCVFIMLTLVATALAGLLVHALIERPLTGALQRSLNLAKPRISKPQSDQILTDRVKNPSSVA